MACQAVRTWTLSGLVSAFLDLVIAYLLLCASAVAYFASKFLGFLGLNLPCPCDGMFFNIRSKNFCLSKLLLDFPTQMVSDVQLSVRQRFPFSDCAVKRDFRIIGDNCGNAILEIEGEASCSSVSDGRKMSECDVKGKRVICHRPRGRLRQRRKCSSVSSLSMEPYSHSSTNKGRNDGDDDNAEVLQLEYDIRAPTKTEMRQWNDSPDEDTHIKQDILMTNNPQGFQSSNIVDEKDRTQLLELTLEEERGARAALYVELEKERSSAATAADEAMAMILRLQEEKASLQMEARQYQRILEEKSAYDAEEMNILKEILLRREKEKHFLEKEVEAYRQMLSTGDGQLSGDDSDKNDGDDDPVLILHQLTSSNEKKKDERSVQRPVCKSISNMDFQEKEILSMDHDSTSKSPQQCDINAKESEQIQQQNLAEKIIVTCDQISDKNTHVYDKSNLSREANCVPDESSVIKRVDTESEVEATKSTSEIARGLPPMGPLRRSAASAVESEMLKIDSEVGRLLERLKLVQEERERLSSISVENRERENVQLKLLEDIARQVQEIRYLTEPGKAVRQGSLPLPASQIFTKKRRSRSVSSGGFSRNSDG